MASAESKNEVKDSSKTALSWVGIPLSFLKKYWVRVALVAILGIYVGEIINDTECWVRIRYGAYQFLQSLSWRKPHAQRTVLVLIGDDEYWKGELESRVPIKRDYLAKLVDAASAANAAVIALDFDLRSPSPEGNPSEFPEYQAETTKLIDAITSASSSGKKIVLTKTLHDEGGGIFVTESDIYEPMPTQWQNVRTGYHVFADDTRRLPPVLKTKTGQLIEPFSLALARAENAPALEDIADFTATLYAGFLPTDKFPKVYATDLLKNDKKPDLANKVVIISGVWHQLGFDRGAEVNAYDTPVGHIPGVFIHANYFEALWDSRIYRVWEGWYMRTTEFFLAFLIALPFAPALQKRTKRERILVGAFPYVLISLASYISVINFGWFFDPLIPVLSVTAHGVLERVLHWRAAAAKYARLVKT